ncbi:MAG: hypothetical protein BWY57_01505 [Betaproteobacteria bacterium ADurb.Bin341]|nr:MAG: hypothetical protein BWY57_01505 [Betaproteobacteria bacterium ADurb.Bin341]
MKLDPLASTSLPHLHDPVRPARGGAEPLIQRVGEPERSAPDRHSPPPQDDAEAQLPKAAALTYKAREASEVASRLLRLAPHQAKKLVRKNIPKHYPPVDEQA